MGLPSPYLMTLATGLCVSLGSSASAQLQFSDQTAAAGLAIGEHGCLPGITGMCEMTGGAAVGDFDRNGYPDIFSLGAGAFPDRLFLNQGGGVFIERGSSWGVQDTHLGGGVAVGDYDGDGWPDVYVTSLGVPVAPTIGQHRLYRNLSGQGFVNVAAAAGVHMTSTIAADGFGAAFGDYDLDGDLDLAVAGWRTAPINTLGNRLFRNDGDGTFTDVTGTAIVFPPETNGFSPTFCDMNGDRYPELLWAADFKTSRYFVNDGRGGFVDATDASGTGLDQNGMGSAVGDLDGDGRLDWYVTSIYNPTLGGTGAGDGNKLYLQQSPDHYREVARMVGLDEGAWGWGTVLVDVDHSGTLDVVETNGYPHGGFTNDPSYLWLNQGGMSFVEVAQQVGFVHNDQGRSLLDLDYDRDGDRDLLIATHSGTLRLYRNDLSGANTAWLDVRLDTSARAGLAPDGIGSLVRVRVGTRELIRTLDGGSHYLGTVEPSAHFGLGSAQMVDELVVEWSDGQRTVLTDVATGQLIVVTP